MSATFGGITNGIYGSMLIAFSLDAFLYGVAMLLVLQYFRYCHHRDSLIVKGLVLAFTILSTTQVATCFAWVYNTLINNFGNINIFTVFPPSAITEIIAVYLLAFLSQCFFATRIWILSKRSWWLTAPIFTLALLQIVVGITATILDSIAHTGLVLAVLQMGATATCDLLITGILCFLFHRVRTGNKSTDGVLNKLIIFSINRGMVTGMAAIAGMILFLLPLESQWLIAVIPTSQLYVIGVLATLNSRNFDRDQSTQSQVGSHNSPMAFKHTMESKLENSDLAMGTHITNVVAPEVMRVHREIPGPNTHFQLVTV